MEKSQTSLWADVLVACCTPLEIVATEVWRSFDSWVISRCSKRPTLPQAIKAVCLNLLSRDEAPLNSVAPICE